MSLRDYSYWEIKAGIPQRKVPEFPTARNFDVLIVGAGFCGAWLAYFLKKRDPLLSIAILERDFFNLGASVRNAGFLSCGNVSEWLEDSRELSWEDLLLTLQGRIEGIRIIQEEWAGKLDFPNCGSVDLDPLTEEKEEFLRRLNASLKELGHDPFYETRTIRFGKEERRVAFNRFDAEVDPANLLLSLHDSLKKQGVSFFWRTEVEEMGKGRAATSRGEIAYERGYLCTNAFARRLHASSCVRPARGQILVTSPVSTATQRSLGFLRSGYDYFRFLGPRVLVGGGRLEFKERENTDQLAVTRELRSYLEDLARRVIGHGDYTIEHHWSGIMGLREGKHASLRDLLTPTFIDEKTEELAGFGGWGVTLTPYLAKSRTTINRIKTVMG